MQNILLIFIVTYTVVHLMMSAVLFLYSRYKIEYLAPAWISAIFSFAGGASIPFILNYEGRDLGIFHPYMLMLLVASSFLQSLQPLGIAMPGYLQWRRMWGYAVPAITVLAIYALGLLFDSEPIIIKSFTEIPEKLLQSDILLRIACLGVSIYYIINIFRLPHLLVKHTQVPRYVKAYGSAIGVVATYYVVSAIFFSITNILIYMALFTLLNLYIFFRTLETMAIHLPKPAIEQVQEAPTTEWIAEVEKEDFNQANKQRFNRVEFFMQQKKEWTDNTFGRDRLCEATGINRHLMLQCLRSQGYNNIHDYINSYRINALKQKIRTGEIKTANESVIVGFGSGKTARNCFERMEDQSLDEYIKEKGPKTAP